MQIELINTQQHQQQRQQNWNHCHNDEDFFESVSIFRQNFIIGLSEKSS